MQLFNPSIFEGLRSPIEAILGNRVNNETLGRSRLTQTSLDPRKNIDQDCGYPLTTSLEIKDYKDFYDRMPIATRVVEIWPHECWTVQPVVFETEDVEEETEFEKAWNELSQSMARRSWFNSKEKNPIWEYLHRVDVLSGIGHFGLLLLGIDDDGKDLREPIEIKENPSYAVQRKLIYLRALDESLVTVVRYEEDKQNPRYGQPTMYNIDLYGKSSEKTSSRHSQPAVATQQVHWTRVIHVADNLGSSELFGVPRQRPVFNRIYDLKKLYGGSGEMYWQGALPGISFETHPQLGGDVEVDEEAIREAMEQYSSRLQRYLLSSGMTAKSLAPQVIDPTGHINAEIEAICIYIGCPKRIFTGSERGELASGQDASTWNKRVARRQNGHVTNRIIVPFIDRCIMIGALPQPETYNVTWPDLDSLSDEAQATIAVQRTEALSKYVQGGVDAFIGPLDYLTTILGIPTDEAQSIVNETVEELLKEFGVEENADQGSIEAGSEQE